MAKITKESVQNILACLGGESNIKVFGNCMTRLRLSLHDERLLELDKLKKREGVAGVVLSDDQVQVVLGPGKAATATEYMAELLGRDPNSEWLEIEEGDEQLSDIVKTQKAELKRKQTSQVQVFLSKFATAFTPLIPGFIAAGLLLGIGTLLEQTIDKESMTSSLLSIIAFLKVFGKGMFTFMSILIGYNVNRSFGGNGVTGAILGSLYILGYDPDAAGKIYSGMSDFLGIIIDPRGNIVGVLISAILAAWVEKKVRKIVPDNLEMVLTTTLTLIIMSIVTFIVIMPIGYELYKAMTWLFVNLSGNPIGSAVLAGLFLVSVMFGIHQGFVPIYFALVESQGFNSLFPVLAMAGAGQVGAAIALYVKSRKNSIIRSQILGAIIPGFLGIGEPLIYGITLPRIKPFVTACIGGAVGGLFIGTISSLGFPIGLNSVFGPSGLVALPLMTSAQGIFLAMGIYLLGLIVSYLAGFFATLLWGIKGVDLS